LERKRRGNRGSGRGREVGVVVVGREEEGCERKRGKGIGGGT